MKRKVFAQYFIIIKAKRFRYFIVELYINLCVNHSFLEQAIRQLLFSITNLVFGHKKLNGLLPLNPRRSSPMEKRAFTQTEPIDGTVQLVPCYRQKKFMRSGK